MSIKIGQLGQNYDAIDIKALQDDLELADKEALTVDELNERVDKEAFAKVGKIPNSLPVKKASDFGLRHAFFDVWMPKDTSTTGVWKLSKSEEGSEEGSWITRDADYD